MKLLLLSLFLLTACSKYNPPYRSPSEVERFFEANNVSEFDRNCILDGVYEIGMSAESVRFMLGDPHDVEIVREPWATREYWSYKRGRKLIYSFIIENGGVVGIQREER